MTKYLSEEDIITINARIIQQTGYAGQKASIKDAEALHFLSEQPRQYNFGVELYPTIPEKAGILLIKLIKKHAFADANKRTATIAFLLFLKRNNYIFTDNWKNLADYVVSIAKVDDNQLNYRKIYLWIKGRIDRKVLE